MNFTDTWILSASKFYLNSVKSFWILNYFERVGHVIFVHCTLSVYATHQHVDVTEIYGKLSTCDVWNGDVSAALETH